MTLPLRVSAVSWRFQCIVDPGLAAADCCTPTTRPHSIRRSGTKRCRHARSWGCLRLNRWGCQQQELTSCCILSLPQVSRRGRQLSTQDWISRSSNPTRAGTATGASPSAITFRYKHLALGAQLQQCKAGPALQGSMQRELTFS